MEEKVILYSLVSRDRSSRISWLLNEMDIPYEYRRLDYRKRQASSPAYLTVNPFSKVPGCVIGKEKLFESGAIIAHLADLYPDSPLFPAVGRRKSRGQFWTWLFFGISTLDSAMSQLIKLDKTPENTERRANAIRDIEGLLEPLDSHLVGYEYILGSRFSASDIPIGYCLALLGRHMRFDKFSNIGEYYERLRIRPAASDFFDAVAQP